MPAGKKKSGRCGYDIYPSHKIAEDRIFSGYPTLADAMADKSIVAVDGYQGVFFHSFAKNITDALKLKGLSVQCIETTALMKTGEEINKLISPFTGGNDPLFGKKSTLSLIDFFDKKKIEETDLCSSSGITLITGPGASLLCNNDLTVYIDIPKNEIQYRMRAGTAFNLGADYLSDQKEMYKRAYFVDWVVLNRHKEKITGAIDIFVDGQRDECPLWMWAPDLKSAMHEMSHSFFRARPWFEPGAWGGTWIRDNISGLSSSVPNYAWSFELITPENGLIIESSSLLFEISFDTLMYLHAVDVLGDCYNRFGAEFPIRFDFLDTFDGGNLSLQCHPRPGYIKDNFGENFTQEEAYYILDTKDDATVYLGFNEDTDPDKFEKALLESYNDNTLFDADRYISKLPASRHDLFLIPYGTIHGSGKNNLVLEISSTPYIYTFKMYDWLRLDLDGKPRPLNIRRGMENLYFDRKGSYVKERLISRPVMIESGPDWELWHLPTHETHLYDVQRYVFKTAVEVKTDNKCLVMSLVEGSEIETESPGGRKQIFHFAETFVIPAAAGSVRIRNLSEKDAMIVKAFVK